MYATTNFGVTSTGSTSYPTVTDTTSSSTSANKTDSSVISSATITASASGILTSIGVYVQTAAGNVLVGIYSTLTGTPTLTGLLGQSQDTVVGGTGWMDISITGVTIASSTSYYLVIQASSASFKAYYLSGGTEYYVTYSYGAFPTTTGTLSSEAVIDDMRMTYGLLTTDSVGDTSANKTDNGVISSSTVVASASGGLTSIGVDVQTAAGNVRLGIYSTLNGTPAFTGLLGQSADTVVGGTGWMDLSVTGVTITAGTTYYVVIQATSSSFKGYYKSGGTEYYVSYTYAAFPATTGTLSSEGVIDTMRITYGETQNAVTKGTRVQYTGSTTANGAVTQFCLYTHTGAAGDHMTLVLYDDSAGSPHLRLWYSATTGTANTTWNCVAYASGTTDNSLGGSFDSERVLLVHVAMGQRRFRSIVRGGWREHGNLQSTNLRHPRLNLVAGTLIN